MRRSASVGVATSVAMPTVLGVLLGLSACVGIVFAAPAHASAYRYWTYWQGTNGAWQFASAGPAFTLPADGSVEGWRFAVTTQQGTQNAAPGQLPDFEAICGATAPVSGSKRVAVVIDPGAQGDAPDGESTPAASSTCVVADVDATGYDVLRSIVDVRTDGGLVCALAGYPARECAPVVDIDPAASSEPSTTPIVTHASAAPKPQATGTPESGGPWVTLAIAAVVIGFGAYLWRRRNRG